MLSDHFPSIPDAPIENFTIRVARTNTNDWQRTNHEMDRSIPKYFEPVTNESKELIAVLTTFINDGIPKIVGRTKITYYRLAK